jgi:hypothetical protein
VSERALVPLQLDPADMALPGLVAELEAVQAAVSPRVAVLLSIQAHAGSKLRGRPSLSIKAVSPRPRCGAAGPEATRG